MKYCILIYLSKDKVSFRYYRDDLNDERFQLFDMVGCGTSYDSKLPLAIKVSGGEILIGEYAYQEALCGGEDAYTDIFNACKGSGSYRFRGEVKPINTLLHEALKWQIGKFFSDTLYGKYGALADNIATLPLVFVFDADLKPEERCFVVNDFRNGGFGNLLELDYNTALLHNVHGNADVSSMVLCASGNDVIVSVFEGKKILNTVRMADAACDPSEDVAVDVLWNSLEAYYENKEASMDLLRQEVRRAMASEGNLAIGELTLANGCYQYSFDKRSVLDAVSNLKATIIPRIKDEVLPPGKDISAYQMVLRGSLAELPYFKREFNHLIPAPIFADSQLYDSMYDALLAYAQSVDFKFTGKSGNAVTGYEPTADEKRRARILERGFAGRTDKERAKQEIREFLSAMHEKGYTGFDDALMPLIGSMSEDSTDNVDIPAPTHREQASQQAVPSSYEPTSDEKRKARILERGFANKTDKSEAKREIREFLDDMHSKGYTGFDSALKPLLGTAETSRPKTAPATVRQEAPRPRPQAPKPEPQRPAYEPTADEKRRARILNKGFTNRTDKDKAKAEIREFLDAMHKKGYTGFDSELKPLL